MPDYHCNALLKWRSKDVTSSLCGHQEHCSSKGSSQTRKITETPGYSKASTTPVPSTVKTQMANDLVHMCTTDTRPLSVVDGNGFKAVAQKLISVGANYGNVSVGDVLPCSVMVTRHLESQVASKKSELCIKLAEAVNVGITTDGWTHGITNVQYITTTVHYIDKDWSMHAHILATRLAYVRLRGSATIRVRWTSHGSVSLDAISTWLNRTMDIHPVSVSQPSCSCHGTVYRILRIREHQIVELMYASERIGVNC